MQLPTVENRLSAFDARLSKIEGIFEQLSTRLTNLESRVDSGFRWFIGIQITMFITLGTLILLKL